MGFLGKLFGKRDIEEALNNLESAIGMLRMGVFGYLLKKVYTSKFGSNEAAPWAMGVLNTMMLLPPGNEEARCFFEKNEDEIWQEALQIKKYPELSGATGRASYLYFAQLFYYTAIYNNPNIDQAKKDICLSKIRDLEERAAQLGVFIPTAKNVCSSNDPIDIIDCICSHSNEFTKSMAG